jgi:hypothetical protein
MKIVKLKEMKDKLEKQIEQEKVLLEDRKLKRMKVT